MAALEDVVSVETVRELVKNNTLEDVSDILQMRFPNQRGLSIKSIKRFCQKHRIQKRNRVTDDELDQLVQASVQQVNNVGKLTYIYCNALQCVSMLFHTNTENNQKSNA